MTPQLQVLTEVKQCFTEARKNLVEGARLLYRVEKEELWRQSGCNSFSEYVETELLISRSQASKLLASYERFVVEGGVSTSKLAQISPETLYLSTKLPGSLTEQLTKAETWTVREMRDELASNGETDCQHLNPIRICGTCHKRLQD